MIAGDAQKWTQDLWIVLVAVWIAGMFKARPNVRWQTSSSRIWQMGIVLFGAWLLFAKETGIPCMDAIVFPVTSTMAIAGVAITAAGVAFAISARMVLGANWSGVVTLKEGHTLVRRGPYRIVRHPIYTGILIAVAGTALTRGSMHNILALPVCGFGLWLKLLTEERFMVEQFGEQYLQYRHEVRALVPFFF